MIAVITTRVSECKTLKEFNYAFDRASYSPEIKSVLVLDNITEQIMFYDG